MLDINLKQYLNEHDNHILPRLYYLYKYKYKQITDALPAVSKQTQHFLATATEISFTSYVGEARTAP